MKKIKFYPELNRYGGYLTSEEILYLDDKVVHDNFNKFTTDHAMYHKDKGRVNSLWFYFKGWK